MKQNRRRGRRNANDEFGSSGCGVCESYAIRRGAKLQTQNLIMHKTSRKSLQDASGVGVVLATKRQNAAGASCAFCQAASSLVTAKRRVKEEGEYGVWLPNVTFQRLNLPSSGCCNPIKNSSWKCREKKA